jgi:hypothetical protein
LALPSLIPERGERALIVGQTGSGKTAMAAWILRRIQRAPIVIYDTKNESKFLSLIPNIITDRWQGVRDAFEKGEHDYIIFRPPPFALDDPGMLDNYLYLHYTELEGIDAYIDEIYSFHSTTGRPFKGLLNLLQRGRSRGITTIMATQRPAFLSKFAMTEAQKMYVFHLGYDPDLERMADFIQGFDKKPRLAPKSHGFYFYDALSSTLTVFKAVKLDKGLDSGYVDERIDKPDIRRASNLVWL